MQRAASSFCIVEWALHQDLQGFRYTGLSNKASILSRFLINSKEISEDYLLARLVLTLAQTYWIHLCPLLFPSYPANKTNRTNRPTKRLPLEAAFVEHVGLVLRLSLCLWRGHLLPCLCELGHACGHLGWDGVGRNSKTCSDKRLINIVLKDILGADATGRLHRLGSNLGARGPHCICQQLSWLHVGAVLTLELCWIQVGPCWVHVGATWSSVGTTSAHVRSKLGLFWRYVGAERVYVGPFWSFVGALLAHVGSMLGPSSPI